MEIDCIYFMANKVRILYKYLQQYTIVVNTWIYLLNNPEDPKPHRTFHTPCANGKPAQYWVSTSARTASTDEGTGANVRSILNHYRENVEMITPVLR